MKTRPEIRLRAEEREQLRNLVRAGKSSARVQTRARILLLAAERSVSSRGGKTRRSNSNQTIAEDLLVSARTVSRVRQRFVAAGLEAAVYDRDRTGRPIAIDGAAEAKLIMLACSQPPAGRSHWTLQLLADQMVTLGFTEHISDTWVLQLLKKTNCDLGASKVGVFPKSALASLPRWKMSWRSTTDLMISSIRWSAWTRKAKSCAHNGLTGTRLPPVQKFSVRITNTSVKAALISGWSVNPCEAGGGSWSAQIARRGPSLNNSASWWMKTFRRHTRSFWSATT